MKKFLKRFGKAASYALAYILITLGTAVGIIFLSPAGGGNKPEEIYIAPQLSHIYENFTEVDYLQLVDLKAEIETPTSNTNLLLNAEVDLTGGLSNLAIDGVLSVLTNGQQLDIDLSYNNGVIYVELLNAKFRIDTSNLSDSLNQILSILNIQIPDLGLDLSSLNPNDILAMLSDLTETKGENNITLNINVPVIGSIRLVCDLNYSIREVSMPKTEISDGTSIAFSSKLAYEDIVVEEPAGNDYIEATHLFNVLGATLDYVNQEEIGFDLDLKYDNLALNGNFSANLKDFSAKFHMTLLDNDLNIIAKDNILYFEFGNIYASFALSDIDLINKFLVDNFDLSLPLNEVVVILEALSKGNLLDIIPSLDLGSSETDLSAIDLSIIQAFEKIDDMYVLSLRDIGTINFGVANKSLTEIGFNGFGVEAAITMTTPANINLSTAQGNYIELKKFIPVIEAAINTSKQSYFAGNGNVILGEYNIGLYFEVSTVDGLRAHLELSIFDEIVNIDLQDETLFLQFKDVKVQANINDFETIKTFLVETFNVILPETDASDVIDEMKMLINPSINPALIKSVTELDNGLTIKLFNDLSVAIRYNDVLNGLNIAFENINVNIDLQNSDVKEIEAVTASEYTAIGDILPIISCVKNYIENSEYYLTLNADFDYQNKQYHIDGSINYDESGISAYAQTTIQGVNIQLKFKDNTVYAELAGLKFMFNLSDLDEVMAFAKETLGLDVDGVISGLKAKVEDLKSNGEKLDIKKLINELTLSLNKDELALSIQGADVKVAFKDSMLDTLTVKAQGLNLNATINDHPSTLDISGEYCNITDLLPIVDGAYSYFASKQYNLSASAKVYDKRTQIYNAEDITLQLDFVNTLNFYADALVTGVENTKAAGFKMAINAALQDDYLYVDYNNLLLKINSKDVEELLVLVMNMLGIDPSILPFLKDTASSGDIDLGAIKGLVPSINMDNPLQMINVLKSIKVDNNTLSLVLDGSFISSDERAENMSVKLVTDGKKLVSLDITNIYTGVTNEEHFDLHINFNEFNGITKIDTSKNYVDISGANELIKAIINTAQNTDFEITGSLKIKMNVIGININWNIPVNVKLKIVDSKPEIMIVVGTKGASIPVVPGVNDDAPYLFGNTTSGIYVGLNRILTIYYKDDYVYFYRHEEVPVFASSNRIYEKKLKAHVDTVFADILYYVQYGLGFSDSIINAIRQSLSIEHEVNLGNVIKGFTVNDNKTYTIELNMGELTGDSKMGNMSIGLGLVNNESTGNKNYVGLITLNMNMPLASSVNLDLQSDNLTLINIGQTIDFTSLYEYINSYPAEYQENVEWEAYNSDWKQANERQFTVTFETNCDQKFDSITGKFGTEFTLPTMENREVVTSTDKDVYRFDGWYSDAALTKPFTDAIIPRHDTTLYAKWTPIEQKRTIEFYNGDTRVDSQYGDIGEALKAVNIPQFIEVEDENHLYRKEFVGWMDEDGLPITKMPTYSTTLYANYRIYETLTKYTLSFETGVGLPLETTKLFNTYSAEAYLADYDTSDRVINADGVTTTYAFAGWYLDSEFTTPFDFTMPSEDITIFAKWDVINVVHERKLVIYDNGTPVYSTLLAEGASVSLPSDIKIDENTKWYTDSEYTNETALPNIMPNEDVLLHIRNKYEVNYNYYVFENGAHTEKQVTLSLYQGENFTLPQQSAYEFDTYKDGHLDRRMYYTFDGYSANGSKFTANIVPNENLTITSNVKEDYKNYYLVSFDTTFVKVNAWNDNNNSFTGKITCKSPATRVDSFYVLDGTTIDPSVYNATATYDYQAAWITKTHYFEVKTWNTSGCQNICAEATGTSNKSYTKLTAVTITGNTTLYATWGVK